MNPATIAILLALFALVILAVGRIHKKKLLFSCGGDCSRCAQADGCHRGGRA